MRCTTAPLLASLPLLLLATVARGQGADLGAVAAVPDAPAPSLDAGTPAGSQPAAGAAADLSPELVQKLSAEQLVEVLKARQHREIHLGQAPSEGGSVEVIVPIAFFLCLGFIVGSVLYYRSRRHHQVQQTLRLMVEKGRDIPPELLVPVAPPRSDLRRGILLIATGVGLSTFLLLVASEDQGAWGLGMIPLLIGVAYLVVWKLAGDGTRSNT